MIRLRKEAFYILLVFGFAGIITTVASARCRGTKPSSPCRCCVNGNWVSSCCPGKSCCDNKGCYDSSERKCCNRGDGSTCSKDSECCDDSGCCSSDLECCDGGKSCYDTEYSKCCGDGDGSTCPKDWECCGSSPGCCPPGWECCDDKSCYNPEYTKCCGDGNGTRCPKDDECCDNGSCAKPCELEEIEGACDGEDVECPMCGTGCSGQYERIYSGNPVYECSEPGCPGDCQDDEVICYTKRLCGAIMRTPATCLPVWPYYGCLHLEPPYPQETCPDCQAGWGEGSAYEPIEVSVPSKKCN